MAKSRPDIGPVGKMLLRSLKLELKQARQMGEEAGESDEVLRDKNLFINGSPSLRSTPRE